MKIKNILKLVTPPIFIQITKKISRSLVRSQPEYEYIPGGWKMAKTNPKIKGWNVDSVLDAYKKNWPVFIKNLENLAPFGLSPEAYNPETFDLVYHNTLMVFAYSLALVSREKEQLKMLDWGGGIGHYYLLSKKLVPGIKIDYYCKDVNILADHGQKLFPEAHFSSDDSYTYEQFDFILSSASLHYVEDWKTILTSFMNCSNGYILITRLPITLTNEPYVFVQRPYQYGYQTEYLSWALSRSFLLEYCNKSGLQLVREFITGERPNIVNAPSPCEYRAFLFKNIRGNKIG